MLLSIAFLALFVNYGGYPAVTGEQSAAAMGSGSDASASNYLGCDIDSCDIDGYCWDYPFLAICRKFKKMKKYCKVLRETELCGELKNLRRNCWWYVAPLVCLYPLQQLYQRMPLKDLPSTTGAPVTELASTPEASTVTTESATTTISPVEEITTEEEHNDLSCPFQSGIFGYPGRCELYIVCTNWVPQVRACPQGLEFLKDQKMCSVPTGESCHESDEQYRKP